MIRLLTPARLVGRLFFSAILTGALTTAATEQGFGSGVINFDYQATVWGLPAFVGAGAIGSAGDIWNTSPNSAAIPVNLAKTDGAPTSVVWDLVGGGSVASAFITGSYARLFDVNTKIFSASILGLTPNQPYSLYLYTVRRPQEIKVNGVAFWSPGMLVNGHVDSLINGRNYATHTVISDSEGTLTFTPTPSTYPGTHTIASWQLTPVPEPSTFTLLTLGSLALVMVRRRR